MKQKLTSLVLALALLLSACAGAGDPAEWQEQYDLGVRYLSEGNYAEAILAFTAAIEIDPRRAEAYVGRGDAYIGSGENEETLAAALADYQKAVDLDESLAPAWLGLTDIHIRQRDFEAALETLRGALEKTENDPDVAGWLAEMEAGTFTDSSGNVRRTAITDEAGTVTGYVDTEVFYIGEGSDLHSALYPSDAPILIFLEGKDYDVGYLYLSELSDVTIQGTTGTRLLSSDGEDTILTISACQNLTLRGLTMGHELGSEIMGCSIGVLWIESSQVSMMDCDIFGCGLQGFFAMDSQVYAQDTIIRDCSYNILEASGSVVDFLNCTFSGNGYDGPSDYGIWAGFGTTVHLTGCVFQDNKNPGFYTTYPEDYSEESTVTVEDCTFSGNAWDGG